MQGKPLELPYEDASFDVVLSQLGLQFFRDPGRALDEMRPMLVADGRLGVSVFSTIERAPAALALSDALDRHVGADASRQKRAEHSLANAAQLRILVADAGFHDIRIATVVKTLKFASVSDWCVSS